jgi:hypothetical protein
MVNRGRDDTQDVVRQLLADESEIHSDKSHPTLRLETSM